MRCYSWVVHFSFPFLVHYRIPGDILAATQTPQSSISTSRRHTISSGPLGPHSKMNPILRHTVNHPPGPAGPWCKGVRGRTPLTIFPVPDYRPDAENGAGP